MTPTDTNFKKDLLQWRLDKAREKLGAANFRLFGAKFLMSQLVVDRILLCAPAGKIKTVDQLVRETGWKREWATEHFGSLSQLVEKHYPPSIENPASKAGKKRCTRCNQTGHICEFHSSYPCTYELTLYRLKPRMSCASRTRTSRRELGSRLPEPKCPSTSLPAAAHDVPPLY